MKRIKREKSLFHRLFILFIIILLPTFFVREYRLIKSKKETRIIPAEDFAYIEVEPDEDKTFTFIVLTHNHRDSIEQNIDSILSQKYSSFRVVYIDQGSTDGTAQEIGKRKSSKLSLIQCEQDHEVYERYYNLVLHAKNDEIIVHLYGNDYLAHDEVLLQLNRSYLNPDVWLTYGQYIDSANYERGVIDPQPKKTLYKKRVQRAPWVVAPFKTYYAGLFKKLHIEEGFFLSIKDENALLIPMAELAKAHVRFIPHVLYIHSEIPSGNRKKERVAIQSAPLKEALHDSRVDLVLLSENTPEDLKVCLLSCEQHLSGVAEIHVIYQCTEKTFSEYEALKRDFPNVSFTRPLDYGKANLKNEMLHSLWRHADSSPYVLLSSDQVSISRNVSLSMCVAAMRKTKADGFYFHLGSQGGKAGEEGIYSWNIRKAEGAHRRPDALQMGLYRRLDLEKELKKLSFLSIHELVEAWGGECDRYRIGLSFEEATVSTSSGLLTQS